jgi:hypothetical protein
MKSVLVIPYEDFNVVTILNHDRVVVVRIDDLIVDPEMRFVFMTSSKIFDGEDPEERRSGGPMGKPLRQSAEDTW